MRVQKELSICVGIILLVLVAWISLRDSTVKSVGRNYSYGLVTDLTGSPIKEDYNSTSEEFKKSYSLEEFIQFSLTTHTSDNSLYVKGDDSMFAHLNMKKIITEQSEFSAKESLADYSSRLNNLKKMQKLAVYIKNTYSVPLKDSEQIVLSSFVEAKKKNLEPTLVLSVIGVESTFQQYSHNKSGAIGLTQVIPKWHQEKIARLKDQDMWSIHGNIKVGTDVLKEYMVLSKGNIRNALQRYNGSLDDPSLKYSNKVLTKMNKFESVIKI